MALLIVENDALRIETGKVTLCNGRRTYTREALERGRSMGPMAFIDGNGNLVVRMES